MTLSLHSKSYPDHPHGTGQMSSHSFFDLPAYMMLLTVHHPLKLTATPRGFKAEVFIGRMPFLPPNLQCQCTEGKKHISLRHIKGHFRDKSFQAITYNGTDN